MYMCIYSTYHRFAFQQCLSLVPQVFGLAGELVPLLNPMVHVFGQSGNGLALHDGVHDLGRCMCVSMSVSECVCVFMCGCGCVCVCVCGCVCVLL